MKMRKIAGIGIITLMGTTLVSCSRLIKINNQQLEIAVNNLMQTKISNTTKRAKPLMNAFSSSEYLVTAAFTAKDFKLQDSKKASFHNTKGEGTIWTLRGTYDKYPLEKVLQITTYKHFPNTAYFKVKYINKGNKDLSVTGWANNHYSLLPSKADSIPFWSFQGSSHADRRDWIQPIRFGLHHKNYMGMNASDYGGGIPVVDLWRRDAGIAIGQSDSIFRSVSLPVRYDRDSSHATVSVQYAYPELASLKPGDTLSTYETFVDIHTGDCFSPLREFGRYMQTKGIIPPKPEGYAFEPVWCAWGYGRNFTVKEILHTLPKVKELGFKWVGIDDGYQQAIGDWHTNNSQFPGGDSEMKALVDSIHKMGMKAVLWWAPMAASPKSNFIKKYPNSLLIQKNGKPQFISWWDSYYLSPTDSITRNAAQSTVQLFLKEWGFDALKLDGQYMNACAPDYAEAHHLSNPNQSIERLPEYFKLIYNTAREINPHAVIEFCPCGTCMNFYLMPYTNQFVASDPGSSWQVRTKALVYHAIVPQTAYYGDHVELVNDDFASQIGVGGVPGSKFVWPKLHAPGEQGLLLTPARDSLFKKWIGLYNKMELSKGDYLGDLYDIGYDYPEAHCIKKDGNMHYAFYNPHFNGNIQLKGLEASGKYAVRDYFHDKSYGTIQGADPNLKVSFTNFLVLEVMPIN